MGLWMLHSLALCSKTLTTTLTNPAEVNRHPELRRYYQHLVSLSLQARIDIAISRPTTTTTAAARRTSDPMQALCQCVPVPWSILSQCEHLCHVRLRPIQQSSMVDDMRRLVSTWLDTWTRRFGPEPKYEAGAGSHTWKDLDGLYAEMMNRLCIYVQR